MEEEVEDEGGKNGEDMYGEKRGKIRIEIAKEHEDGVKKLGRKGRRKS